ncbi:MAG: T9SS type A sorting domain-containing protein [Bacteroidota bacterium]
MKTLKVLLSLLLILSFSSVISQTIYYASNRVLNAVNAYDEDGNYLNEFIEKDSGGLSNPQDIVLHPDNFLLVTGSNNEQIKKFDALSGAYLGDWSDDSFDLGRPSKMSIGPDGLLYVTQWGTTSATARVVRFDMDGNYLGGFTPLAPTGLGHVWDDDGNFYLAVFGVSTGIGNVRKYDPNGNLIEIFIDSTFLENPTYIWWDSNGDMLVQDFTAGKVLRYDNNGDYLGEFITGLSNPEGITVLENGHILISERGANQITEFDSDGTLIGQWDDGVGTLAGPNFIEPIETPTFGIDDLGASVVMVTPTMGRQFNFEESLTGDYESIRIYNMAGVEVETIHLDEQRFWNASGWAEGMYFLVALDVHGRKSHQKIIVSK